YETFGLTIIEAFACGTPVLASRIGAPNELVEEGVTGRSFMPGDARDMRRAVATLLDGDPRELRPHARRAYEARHTPERNHEDLMAIYAAARATASARLPAT
ncbi:MAG: glycosyltransferase family 4 protein, partial [Gemmatimonadaceae bacterium]|nr:glycosyltransferase family 4 protein [Gemmatimonadaceae bacterium]